LGKTSNDCGNFRHARGNAYGTSTSVSDRIIALIASCDRCVVGSSAGLKLRSLASSGLLSLRRFTRSAASKILKTSVMGVCVSVATSAASNNISMSASPHGLLGAGSPRGDHSSGSGWLSGAGFGLLIFRQPMPPGAPLRRTPKSGQSRSRVKVSRKGGRVDRTL